MKSSDLFADSLHPERITLPDGELLWCRQFLAAQEANDLMATLQETIPWRQDSLRIGGKQIPIPRLQAWYGDQGTVYSYSGLTLQPLPWLPVLEALKNRIEQHSGSRFNSLLANLYRNENDSVGWHADNEPELGLNPVIASLSLGESRDFHLKHRKSTQEKRQFTLQHGDLLVMQGALQHHWLHQVPKAKIPCQPRINLTFRQICMQ